MPYRSFMIHFSNWLWCWCLNVDDWRIYNEVASKPQNKCQEKCNHYSPYFYTRSYVLLIYKYLIILSLKHLTHHVFYIAST